MNWIKKIMARQEFETGILNLTRSISENRKQNRPIGQFIGTLKESSGWAGKQDPFNRKVRNPAKYFIMSRGFA
jgi:hypothetical protein